MESTDSSGETLQPQLPPGFRFHPTDEELVVHYLKKKAASAPLPVAIIAEVDLYKFDPWELPAKAIFGEQEWYFFSPRDRKYPNGARPNRAATSGYWKATGTDKPVMTAGGTEKVGVKKALVFYGGKPPRGIKTNWIMHEYRLADNKSNSKPPGCDVANKKASLRLDDWVLCRIYKKNNIQRPLDQDRDVDTNQVMGMVTVHPTIPMTTGLQLHKGGVGGLKGQNYSSLLLENQPNFYHGGIDDTSRIPLVVGDSHLLLHGKRMVSNLYWNEETAAATEMESPSTKRYLSESCCEGSSMGRTDDTTNSIAMVLSQLPQTNPMHQQQAAIMGNLEDNGLFRQPPYPTMNWYS